MLPLNRNHHQTKTIPFFSGLLIPLQASHVTHLTLGQDSLWWCFPWRPLELILQLGYCELVNHTLVKYMRVAKSLFLHLGKSRCTSSTFSFVGTDSRQFLFTFRQDYNRMIYTSIACICRHVRFVPRNKNFIFPPAREKKNDQWGNVFMN